MTAAQQIVDSPKTAEFGVWVCFVLVMQLSGFPSVKMTVLHPDDASSSVSDYDRRYTRGSVLQSDPQAGAAARRPQPYPCSLLPQRPRCAPLSAPSSSS